MLIPMVDYTYKLSLWCPYAFLKFVIFWKYFNVNYISGIYGYLKEFSKMVNYVKKR